MDPENGILKKRPTSLNWLVCKAEVGRKGLWWATATGGASFPSRRGKKPAGGGGVEVSCGDCRACWGNKSPKKMWFQRFFVVSQLASWDGRWTFFFYFNFYIPGFLGEMIQFGEHIFQMGWNYQLEKNLSFLLVAWVGWSVPKSVVFLFFLDLGSLGVWVWVCFVDDVVFAILLLGIEIVLAPWDL